MTHNASLIGLTVSRIREGLGSGEFSAAELVEAHIIAGERAEYLGAYITKTPEIAREQAICSDRKISENEAGLLEGIPLAVKDLFCTKGVRTTAASKILDGFVPTYESRVTENLWGSGAVLLGKANMDEFAMGSSNATSNYGPVVNPWKRMGDDTKLAPGGSSGGSAALVAAGVVPAAIGTDTGGSIRQPAAFCGVVGMKPTYGRCSRWGTIAFASSLDQAGPITRSVRDAAIILESMSGHDDRDSTSVDRSVPPYEESLDGSIKGLKVGVPREYLSDSLSEDINELWSRGGGWLKESGAELVDISLPHTKYALPSYYIIAPAEASSNLARYDGVKYGMRVPDQELDVQYSKTRGTGFGPEVKRRIMIGTYVLSAGYYEAYYIHAQKVRRLIADDFNDAFKKVDIILTPTTPNEAFGLEDKLDDPVSMYLNDVFTVPASLAGLPAMSVPCGLSSSGLPLGLQLIGPAFEEARLFQFGERLEEAAEFTYKPSFYAG
jgi:aspartyl-tRNA(Asn)/glutamyl-tRNA(Gln) amidotransferase subunit A